MILHRFCSVLGHVSHTQKEDQIALEMWASPRRISLRTESLLLSGYLRPEVPGVLPSLGRIAITVILCEAEIATLGWEMAVGALLRNWGLFFLWRTWIPVFGQCQSTGPRPTCLRVDAYVDGIQWVRGGSRQWRPPSGQVAATAGAGSARLAGNTESPHSGQKFEPTPTAVKGGGRVSGVLWRVSQQGEGAGSFTPLVLSLDSSGSYKGPVRSQVDSCNKHFSIRFITKPKSWRILCETYTQRWRARDEETLSLVLLVIVQFPPVQDTRTVLKGFLTIKIV